MSAAVVDSPHNEHARAWWFLDLLVVEHRRAPGMETVVLEMTLPVGCWLSNQMGSQLHGMRKIISTDRGQADYAALNDLSQ